MESESIAPLPRHWMDFIGQTVRPLYPLGNTLRYLFYGKLCEPQGRRERCEVEKKLS